MKWTEEQIERVRNISIAGMLGLQMGRDLSICCPFPDHRDKSPSCRIYKTNSYHCFGCGKTGHGYISFLKDMGYSFTDIMKEFSQ